MARFVTAIYCDDVRHEIGSKQSYIGIYRAKLFVPQFPTILPKLFVIVHVSTPSEQPIKTLIVKVLKGEKILIEAPVAGSVLDAQSSGPQPKEDGTTFCAELHFAFTPFPLEEPTRLRVRVNIDGEEFKGPALEIEKATPAEDAAPAGQIPKN